MRGIAGSPESPMVAADRQGDKGADILAVGCAEDGEATRGEQSRNLAHEGARILQVLDHLGADDRVERAGWARQWFVEVGSEPVDGLRQSARAGRYIRRSYQREQTRGMEAACQVAHAGAEVEQCATSATFHEHVLYCAIDRVGSSATARDGRFGPKLSQINGQ